MDKKIIIGFMLKSNINKGSQKIVDCVIGVLILTLYKVKIISIK